jgi:hypothetical protein
MRAQDGDQIADGDLDSLCGRFWPVECGCVTQQLVLNRQPSAKARLLHSLAMKKFTGLVATTMLVRGGLGLVGFGLASDAEALELG